MLVKNNNQCILGGLTTSYQHNEYKMRAFSFHFFSFLFIPFLIAFFLLFCIIYSCIDDLHFDYAMIVLLYKLDLLCA